MITTFCQFIQSLPAEQFFVCVLGEEPAVYPVEEAEIDWENPEVFRPVEVLWNEECTIALVSAANSVDPHCTVIKAKSVVFGAQ